MAWNEWIKGASSCQNPINRESKKCKTFADEDSEAEYEWQVEEEHWDDDTEFETLTPYYYDSEKGLKESKKCIDIYIHLCSITTYACRCSCGSR